MEGSRRSQSGDTFGSREHHCVIGNSDRSDLPSLANDYFIIEKRTVHSKQKSYLYHSSSHHNRPIVRNRISAQPSTHKKERPPLDTLEKTHKVTREHMSSALSSRFVKKLTAPPSIFGRRRHSNDISRLEIEFFLDRRRIIV